MSTRQKISKLVATVITVVVVGSIIWFATPTVSAAAEKPKYTFYVVTHGVPGCPFWSVVDKGAIDAGKLLNVKVVYTCPDSFDIKKVADLLEAAVEAKPDGIVCPITSAEAFDPILRRAIKKGIPLIVHNVTDLRPPEKRIPYKTYVGEDSWACGYEVMKHALKRMKDNFGVKVNHVMFGIHEAGNVVHETRSAGAIAALKEMAPDATYEKVMVTYDLPKVEEITKSYLTRHPETNLILNFNSIVAHTACSANVSELDKAIPPPRYSSAILVNTIRRVLRREVITLTFKIKITPEFGSLVSFLCIFTFFGLFAPKFLAIGPIASVLNMSAEFGIVVVGVTFLMTGGEFDLSVGSVFALGNFVFIYSTLQNFPIFLAFILAISCGVIIGAINGWITTKFLVPSLIVTIGMLWGVRGLLLFFAARQWWTIHATQSTFFDVLNGKTFGLYNAIFWLLALLVIGHIILENTRFGNQIRACGGNKVNARFIGVNVNKLKMLTFMLTGGLAAFAGTANLSRFRYFHWYLGVGMELEVIAAVVLGGTLLTGGYGTLIGSLIGILLLSTLRNGMIFLGVPGYWYEGVIGAFLIIAMVLNIRLRPKIQ